MELIDDILDEFYYEMYIAERDMLDKISSSRALISNGILSEEAIISIQEGVKDSVMNYIHKIISGTQNAWNNFKSSIADKAIGKFYDDNKEYFKSDFVMKPPKGFSMPNVKEFETFMSNTTIPPYSQSMNSYLDNEQNFLKKYIPTYSSELSTGKSLKEIGEKKLFTEAQGTENIGSNSMDTIVKFAAIEYKKTSEKLSTNLKNLNSSTRTMESLLKSTSSTNESVINSYGLNETINTYFTEDGEDKKDNSTSSNQSQSNNTSSLNTTGDNKENKGFTNANPSQSNDKDKNNEMDKIAQVYFKSCTSVISTQLSLTNKMVLGCFKMMNEYVKLQKKDKKDDNKKTNDNNEPNNKPQETQVKID